MSAIRLSREAKRARTRPDPMPTWTAVVVVRPWHLSSHTSVFAFFLSSSSIDRSINASLQNASRFTWVRRVSRRETSAGNCTASSTASSPTAPCLPTSPWALPMTHSTPSSARLPRENTSLVLSTLTWNPPSATKSVPESTRVSWVGWLVGCWWLVVCRLLSVFWMRLFFGIVLVLVIRTIPTSHS